MCREEVPQAECVCRTTDVSVIADSSAARAVKSASCRQEGGEGRNDSTVGAPSRPPSLLLTVFRRLNWAGHLARMNEDRCRKNIFRAKAMENRPRD
ncbi:hypothetical protein TNCV_5136221 [Trichonephila clavipes]|nr:hypothetical protein TNCV_5136221 [Trichonephila clavipes]